MRTTCIRCAIDHVETQLVPCGEWMVCPIHSADLIEEVKKGFEGYAIVKRPELLGKGVPNIHPVVE